MKRYVVGFLFAPDGETVWLLRKKKPEWQAGLLNGIGGHVEVGELYFDAMDRECMEETQQSFDWALFAIMSSVSHPKGSSEHWEMFCYRAVAKSPIFLPLTNDIGESYEEVGIAAVAKGLVKTIPNLRWLVPMALADNDRKNWPYRIGEGV